VCPARHCRTSHTCSRRSKQSAAVAEATLPTGFQESPGGDLFYAEFDDGTLRRIQYFSGNQPPIVVATAIPQNGTASLEVQFDASGSHDPDPGDTRSSAPFSISAGNTPPRRSSRNPRVSNWASTRPPAPSSDPYRIRRLGERDSAPATR
jgi:hypothetical protein